MRTPTRLAHLVVVAAMIATVLAPFSAARASCPKPRPGFWSTIGGPNFKSGSQAITSFTVNAQAPNQLFVSNGKVVMRSVDLGCAWKQIFDVATDPTLQKPAVGTAVIEAIVIPERRAERMYLVIEEQTGPTSSPHVMIGTNGGDDWRAGDVGLAPVGAPSVLRVAPNDPQTAYLTVDVAGSADVLYATTNGGDAWQAKGQSPTPGVIDLEIDPSNQNDLWIGGTAGLFHSTDGGGSFTPVNEFANQSTGPIDVFHSGRAPARIMAFLSAGAGGRYSSDGGKTWLALSVPGPPNSVAHGSIADQVVLAANSRVYAYAPSIVNWVDLVAPSSGIKGMLASRAGPQAFFGFTSRTIELYVGPTHRVDIPEDVVEIPDISLLDNAPPDLVQQARLTPATSKVKIALGKTKTVPYDLRVPRTLTPLDVFFVVDTSSSMTQVIKEAAEALEEIHNGLVASGAAVEFGLGEYRSYPTDVPPRPDTDNYVYQRVLDIGASAPQMAEAIAGLTAQGGGIYDAQLEALWQAGTGAGVDVWPPGPSSRDVPPGRQPNFRKKALRVILHVGDEPFGSEESASDNDNNITRPEAQVAKPDIPNFEAVAEALRAKGVKQLGLSLYPDATKDLRKMARATGALAPLEGVDCDRNGSIDVAGGEPLVCVLQQDEIDNANMAPAIVELVEAIRSRSEVGLTAEAERDVVVQSITPELYDGVLLQADNSLEFEVTYRCPRTLAGKTTKVDLRIRGLIGEPPVASTKVTCAPLEKKDEPVIPPNVIPGLSIFPLIPLAAPPPPPNPPSASQAQAQAQANAAFAAQEQEQPQVAFAHQMHSEINAAFAKEEDYAFTSLRKKQEPPYPLWGAALLMTAAFSVAMSTRTRVRLRYARRRPPF